MSYKMKRGLSILLGAFEFILIFGLIFPYIINRYSSYLASFSLRYTLPLSDFDVFLITLVISTVGLSLVTWSFITLIRVTHYIPFDIFHPLLAQPKIIATSPPYNIVRHPFMAGYLLFLLGITIPLKSFFSILLIVILVFPLFIIYALGYEERLLLQRFGEEYLNYKKRVDGFIPFRFIVRNLKDFKNIFTLVTLIVILGVLLSFLTTSKTTYATSSCSLSFDPIYPRHLNVVDRRRVEVSINLHLRSATPSVSYFWRLYRQVQPNRIVADSSSVINPQTVETDNQGMIDATTKITFNLIPDLTYYLEASWQQSSTEQDVCQQPLPNIPTGGLFIPSSQPCNKNPDELSSSLERSMLRLGPAGAGFTTYMAGLTVRADQDGLAIFNLNTQEFGDKRQPEGTPVEITVIENPDSPEARLQEMIELCEVINLSNILSSQRQLSLITIRTGRPQAEVYLAYTSAYTDQEGVARIEPEEEVHEGSRWGLTVVNRNPADPEIPDSMPIFGSDQNLWAITSIIDVTDVVKASEENLKVGIRQRSGRLQVSVPSLPLPSGLTSTETWIWPARGAITTFFSSWHPGIDIANYSGTPISASKMGLALFVGWNNQGYGNTIDLSHTRRSFTRYAHLQRFNVSRNIEAAQGQVIGHMDSTGRSTGSHLHFELYNESGVPISPLLLLR